LAADMDEQLRNEAARLHVSLSSKKGYDRVIKSLSGNKK
jgi:hypothetical protein